MGVVDKLKRVNVPLFLDLLSKPVVDKHRSGAWTTLLVAAPLIAVFCFFTLVHWLDSQQTTTTLEFWPPERVTAPLTLTCVGPNPCYCTVDEVSTAYTDPTDIPIVPDGDSLDNYRGYVSDIGGPEVVFVPAGATVHFSLPRIV